LWSISESKKRMVKNHHFLVVISEVKKQTTKLKKAADKPHPVYVRVCGSGSCHGNAVRFHEWPWCGLCMHGRPDEIDDDEIAGAVVWWE